MSWRLMCWLAPLLILSVVPLAGQRRRAPVAPEKTQPELEAQVPFRAGEKLDYRIAWAAFSSAASVGLQVRERRPFFGRHAWHFQAVARTLQPVRFIYELDDQFDSYTDTVTLGSLQYEQYLREEGRTENTVVRLVTEEMPVAGDGAAVRVPAGTCDPLGYLFYLRAVSWPAVRELRTPLYDGKKLYEVRARLLAEKQEARVPAGKFPATRIEIRVFERGRELAHTRFFLWLARDASQTPVRMEAELPFGNLRVELLRAQS